MEIALLVLCFRSVVAKLTGQTLQYNLHFVIFQMAQTFLRRLAAASDWLAPTEMTDFSDFFRYDHGNIQRENAVAAFAKRHEIIYNVGRPGGTTFAADGVRQRGLQARQETRLRKSRRFGRIHQSQILNQDVHETTADEMTNVSKCQIARLPRNSKLSFPAFSPNFEIKFFSSENNFILA